MAKKKDADFSLSRFIDDNHKLISSVGIFTALTVFSTSISLKPIGYLVSFLSLAATFILWIELWFKFPRNRNLPVRLSFFKFTVLLILLTVTLYWLLEFRNFWRYFLVLPLTFILTYMFFSIVAPFMNPVLESKNKIGKSIDSFEKRHQWFSVFYSMFLFAAMLGILGGSYYLSLMLNLPINYILDIFVIWFQHGF